MKIIKKGLCSKDGIYFKCQYCGCEYLIEDRNDFKISIDKDVTDKRLVRYIAKCPDCNFESCLFYNPHHILGYTFLNKYSVIFNRPDWDERFEISLEEAEKRIKNDSKISEK